MFQGFSEFIGRRSELEKISLKLARAGILNTIFGLAIYPILLLVFDILQHHFMAGLIIAQILSICFAFTIYKLTVFKTKSGAFREFLRFVPFYLFNYAINWAVLPVLVKIAFINPIIAQTGFSLVIIVSSFFWHSRVTFKGEYRK